MHTPEQETYDHMLLDFAKAGKPDVGVSHEMVERHTRLLREDPRYSALCGSFFKAINTAFAAIPYKFDAEQLSPGQLARMFASVLHHPIALYKALSSSEKLYGIYQAQTPAPKA